MQAEIKLQYRIDLDPPQDDYIEVVDVSCVTELSNMAHAMLKTSGAENVNFHLMDKNE